MDPRKRRGAGLAADSPKLKPSLITCCQILRSIQRPFAWIFWQIESAIARIDVEIERRRS